MKIETPQILWHNGSEGNGKPAPLYSVSLLPTSAADRAKETSNDQNGRAVSIDPSSTSSSTASSSAPASASCEILATAGNSNEIHIWKLKLTAAHHDPSLSTNNPNADGSTTSSNAKQSQCEEPPAKKPKIFSISSPCVTHITTLTRHERSINTVSFSPHGTHLASAGDGGTLILHTVPSSHRKTGGKKNTHSFWNDALTSEKDLNIKLVHTGSEDVMDLSWSQDEMKFMIGTLDHSVLVYQESRSQSDAGILTKGWNCVWKNTKEHTHYVQGVAFDPLSVYLASQGSDRSVRVWQRKGAKSKGSANNSASSGGNGKKKVLGDHNQKTDQTPAGAMTPAQSNAGSGVLDVERQFGNKFDVGKAKVLKYRSEILHEGEKDANANATQNVKKSHLFADESTVESFFRRLSWTPDGAFLVIPASLWHKSKPNPMETNTSSSSSPSFATYLFARHQFDKPFRVLHGMEKPSVVIRPNPVLFQLPNHVQNDSKENLNSLHSSPSSVASNEVRRNDSILPYRSLFAVLTVDSILIYDTYHSSPLCIASGLHYAGLTDCSWSSDGHHLVVSSTDGYISMISFADGELGEVYHDDRTAALASQPSAPHPETTMKNLKSSISAEIKSAQKGMPSPPVKIDLPPCEPGQSAMIMAPPTKKARTALTTSSTVNTLGVRKKKKITPAQTTVQSGIKGEDINGMSDPMDVTGRQCTVEKEVVGGVTKLSLTSSTQ